MPRKFTYYLYCNSLTIDEHNAYKYNTVVIPIKMLVGSWTFIRNLIRAVDTNDNQINSMIVELAMSQT